MAGPLPEVVKKRIFDRVYVCMKCNATIKSDISKVESGKVKCRKCKSKALRTKKKGLKK